jgi:hypothetical protein
VAVVVEVEVAGVEEAAEAAGVGAVVAGVRVAAVVQVAVRVAALARVAEWVRDLGRALALVRPALAAARGPDLLREAPEAGMAAAW